MHLIRAGLLIAVMTGPPAQADEVPEALVLSYHCDDAVGVTVAYLNTADGASYAVVLHDGTLTPMKAGPTGSGVRYVSLTDPALVWHSKGNDGFLAHDDADETLIAGNCVSD